AERRGRNAVLGESLQRATVQNPLQLCAATRKKNPDPNSLDGSGSTSARWPSFGGRACIFAREIPLDHRIEDNSRRVNSSVNQNSSLNQTAVSTRQQGGSRPEERKPLFNAPGSDEPGRGNRPAKAACTDAPRR